MFSSQVTDHRVGLSRTVPSLAGFFLGEGAYAPVEDFRQELARREREEKVNRRKQRRRVRGCI